LEDGELMPEGEDLEVQGNAGTEHGDQGNDHATGTALMAGTVLPPPSLLNGADRDPVPMSPPRRAIPQLRMRLDKWP
jgi:hypothetical protein